MGNCGCVPQKRAKTQTNTQNKQNIQQPVERHPTIKQEDRSSQISIKNEYFQKRYCQQQIKELQKQKPHHRQRQSVMNMKKMICEFVKQSPMPKDQQTSTKFKLQKPINKRQSMAKAYYQMTGRPI